MTESDTRTKHIEVPTDLFELPAAQAAAAMPVSAASAFSTIAKTSIGGKYNTIIGTTGNDVLRGGAGRDLIFGGKGKDKLYGGRGNDHLEGQWGNDLVYGEAGNDELRGEDGNDKLYGGAGNDILFGEDGRDTMTGGPGRDTFELLLVGAGIDKIMDFTSGSDKLALQEYHGPIRENNFVRGTAAQDEDDYVIYDQGTGNLYFDPDGNGESVPVVFAINVRKSAIFYYDLV